MRNEIVAWYAYSESGAAGTAVLEPARRETTPGASHPGLDREDAYREPKRMSGHWEPGDGVPGVDGQSHLNPDALSTSRVAGLFADVRKLDAEVDAREWRHLFSRYGLEALIDLAKGRRAGWPDGTSDETVAEAIVSESLDAGYDAVSGLIGTYERSTRQFEPHRRMGIPPMPQPQSKKQHE